MIHLKARSAPILRTESASEPFPHLSSVCDKRERARVSCLSDPFSSVETAALG